MLFFTTLYFITANCIIIIIISSIVIEIFINIIMSRNRWSAVYEHLFEEGNNFRCRVMLDQCHTCNSVIPKLKQGSTSANLKRHLKRQHRQALDRVEKKDSEATKKQNC